MVSVSQNFLLLLILERSFVELPTHKSNMGQLVCEYLGNYLLGFPPEIIGGDFNGLA